MNKFIYVVKQGDLYLGYHPLHGGRTWLDKKNKDCMQTEVFTCALNIAEENEGTVIKRFPDNYEKPIISFEHP